MYRIFILSLLAIVFTTFALEPSQVILRATEIRGDSMVIEWSPIEGAITYKVLYDEKSLINPNAPEPILESSSTEKTSLEIQKMMDGTEYYIIVHGFDQAGTKVGQTIPLHASTLRNPLFVLKESLAVDDHNISLTFSHPIDLKNTQIEILNTETKKPRIFKEIKVSSDDLRIVQILLEGKLAAGISHDIVLKKVTNTSGVEMPPESKKSSTIMYSILGESVVPVEPLEKVDTLVAVEMAKDKVIIPIDTSPDTVLDVLQKKTEDLGIDPIQASVSLEDDEQDKTPVVIDQLPQTGASGFILVIISLALGACLSYKKRISL